ncbi:PEP-CTERM sorting domain-containing protein [Tundrisphaera lichenicola]|uniref:PEP-CTERM sorting domain-containing protein n=1 Tax=Tundrisphaera lichenicola TaxID=2029860 RepID=UPI003EB91F8A
MKALGSFSFFLIFGTLVSGVQAEFLYQGSYYIQGGSYRSESKSDTKPVTIDGSLFESNGQITLDTVLSGKAGPYGLGLKLDFHGNDGGLFGGIHKGGILVQSFDAVRLVARTPTVIVLPNTQLFFNGTLTGYEDSDSRSSFNQLNMTVAVINNFTTLNLLGLKGPLGAVVTGNATLDSQLRTSFSISAGLSFGLQNFEHVVDASHTFELTSITFADGTTPEQLGYDLVFDSGRISPNLRSVPEPSSFILLSLGSLGLYLAKAKRTTKRRLAAPETRSKTH